MRLMVSFCTHVEYAEAVAELIEPETRLGLIRKHLSPEIRVPRSSTSRRVGRVAGVVEGLSRRVLAIRASHYRQIVPTWLKSGKDWG